MSKIKVAITSGYRWESFQWFLLGFMMLDKAGQIDFEYDCSPYNKFYLQAGSKLSKLAGHFMRHHERDSYIMTGYIESGDGRRKRFCIDEADAPYLYDATLLETCGTYFKMQYPIGIDQPAFSLTTDVMFPWSSYEHVDERLTNLTDIGPRKQIDNFAQYRSKIQPLMVGPRRLAKACSWQLLQKGYDHYLSARNLHKKRPIMCYFGNAQGPEPSVDVEKPDLRWEQDIMGYYGPRISHPNVKRARVAQYLRDIPGADARIISRDHSDSGRGNSQSLVVPMREFCHHIANFAYNVNVSGYVMSMPSRFIESFLVGTAVLTDKLSVKWYKPFEAEVVETVPMGYMPMERVDWQQFQQDLQHLPQVDAEQVIQAYEAKWAPDAVARYIIDTVVNARA